MRNTVHGSNNKLYVKGNKKGFTSVTTDKARYILPLNYPKNPLFLRKKVFFYEILLTLSLPMVII